MTADKQAYTGFAGLHDVNSEWNRLHFAIRSILAGVATATLVLVKAVKSTTDGFTVDVQPMVAQVDGAGNAIPHGTIHGLPVWRVQGGTSGVIVTPTVGDIGLAVFASTDISGVKRSASPTTPGSARRFDWADGIYLGGVLNKVPTQFVRLDDEGVTITSASGLPVTINAPGGVVVNADKSTFKGDVDVTGKISTGTGSTFKGDAEVTGKLTTGPGSTFNKKVFDTHTHSGVTTGAGKSGPPV